MTQTFNLARWHADMQTKNAFSRKPCKGETKLDSLFLRLHGTGHLQFYIHHGLHFQRNPWFFNPH